MKTLSLYSGKTVVGSFFFKKLYFIRETEYLKILSIESTKVLSLPYKGGETKIKDQRNKNLKRDDNIIKFNFSPYHPSSTPNSVLELLPITNFTNDEVVRNFSNQDLYQFRISSENEDNDENFFPGRLCVRKNERNFERPLRGKIDGKDNQRLLLLSQDGLRYKVLQYNLQ